MSRWPIRTREASESIAAARSYCRAVLPRVSRTFALNIRVLPAPLQDVVREAYLLCRIADTVEDSRWLAAETKPHLLRDFAAIFPLGEDTQARAEQWARPFAAIECNDADHALCRDAAIVLRAFAAEAAALRVPVEACVHEMALGMRDFAARRVRTGRLQLEDGADLERYCHVVAGTVGAMLVRLFATTSTRLDVERERRLSALAEPFGRAMQLTNIVKDMADDLCRGACYVPRAWAQRRRIAPEALLDPGSRAQARQVLGDVAALAARSLDAALAFTLVLPRREVRLRLFCLWPLFLAASTLRRCLLEDAVFVAGARARLRRSEVRRTIGTTSAFVFSDSAIRWLYGRRRAALKAVLPRA